MRKLIYAICLLLVSVLLLSNISRMSNSIVDWFSGKETVSNSGNSSDRPSDGGGSAAGDGGATDGSGGSSSEDSSGDIGSDDSSGSDTSGDDTDSGGSSGGDSSENEGSGDSSGNDGVNNPGFLYTGFDAETNYIVDTSTYIECQDFYYYPLLKTEYYAKSDVLLDKDSVYITDFYSSIFVYEEGATNDYVASSLFNELFVSELDFVETCISVPPFSAIEFSIYDTANCFYFENYYYYLLVYNKNEY